MAAHYPLLEVFHGRVPRRYRQEAVQGGVEVDLVLRTREQTSGIGNIHDTQLTRFDSEWETMEVPTMSPMTLMVVFPMSTNR